MKLKTITLTLAVACTKLSGLSAQDIHFSQIFETPLLRNPSLAGLFNGDIRLQTVYRTQWNSVTVPYQTTSVSGEVKQKIGNGDDYLSYGGQIVYDKAGSIALTTTQVLPTINYNKSMSAYKNVYLSLGFMGGLVQRSFDRNKMTTNNQYDGTAYNPNLADGEMLNNASLSYFDGSAGISLNSQLGNKEVNNFYVGVAYHHFNQARRVTFYNTGRERMTPKWVGSFGIRMEMTNTSYFTLQSDYAVQGKNQEWICGALYSWRLDESDDNRYVLHAGTYMRWRDAIIPALKLEFKPLAVALSYDANISPLKQSSQGRGGFEMSISYQKNKKYNSSMDQVRCPKF
jgi:type IX secretion system PorP/SprF family membrane protein